MTCSHTTGIRSFSVLITLIVTGIVPSCAPFHSGNATQVPQLPAWFWDMPRASGAYYAVGYSRPHRPGPDAFDDAFSDAVRRLYFDVFGVRYLGEIGLTSTPHGYRVEYNTVEPDTVDRDIGEYASEVVRIDSFRTHDMLVMLIGTRKSKVDSRIIPSSSDVPEATGLQGTERDFRFPSSSWTQAESAARTELCMKGPVGMRSMQKKLNDRIQIVTIMTVDSRLSGVQTTTRRFDASSRIYRVWVKGSVE